MKKLTMSHSMNTADQVREAGLSVGDTIQGRERSGDHWNDAQLRLLFLGRSVCVWMCRYRDSKCTDWSMWREQSNWTLSCRDWYKLEPEEITELGAWSMC